MKRRSRELNLFNMSALDLFASGMGAFIVIAVILFPYYLKNEDVINENRKLKQTKSSLEVEEKSIRTALITAEDGLKKANAAEGAIQTAIAKAIQENKQAAANLKQKKEDVLAANKRAADREANLGKIKVETLDLVFVMDTTGSMQAIIDDLRGNLISLVRILHKLSPDIRIGFSAYRDHGEAYVTKDFPLTEMSPSGYQRLQKFVDELSAEAGGDYPEAVEEGMKKASAMDWRAERKGLIVLIGDAPAHDKDWDYSMQLASSFHASSSGKFVSSIYTDTEEAKIHERKSIASGRIKAFYENLSNAGGGEFIEHAGGILSSVLILVFGI